MESKRFFRELPQRLWDAELPQDLEGGVLLFQCLGAAVVFIPGIAVGGIGPNFVNGKH